MSLSKSQIKRTVFYIIIIIAATCVSYGIGLAKGRVSMALNIRSHIIRHNIMGNEYFPIRSKSSKPEEICITKGDVSKILQLESALTLNFDHVTGMNESMIRKSIDYIEVPWLASVVGSLQQSDMDFWEYIQLRVNITAHLIQEQDNRIYVSSIMREYISLPEIQRLKLTEDADKYLNELGASNAHRKLMDANDFMCIALGELLLLQEIKGSIRLNVILEQGSIL